MDEYHKRNLLKPVITSTPCGRVGGNMWDMLNSGISPIGDNISDNITIERKLLPRPVQRTSVPKHSGPNTGIPPLSNRNYLAEYRVSAKHSGIHSSFPRLEIIESDDDDDADDDDEIILRTVKVSDKNAKKPVRKKKTAESNTVTHKKEEMIESDDDETIPRTVKVSDKNASKSVRKKKTAESNTVTHKKEEIIESDDDDDDDDEIIPRTVKVSDKNASKPVRKKKTAESNTVTHIKEEMIESDDDETIPRTVKVSDKNASKPVRKKKTAESNTVTHKKEGISEIKHEFRETEGDSVSEVKGRKTIFIKKENKQDEGNNVKRTEVNVLIPRRISVKGPSASSNEVVEIKQPVVNLVRHKPVLQPLKTNTENSLPPTRETFKKENETNNTEATEVQTTTQQYKSRKRKHKVNSLMSNDSDTSDPVKPKDGSSIAVIQVMARRLCKILKPTHEMNSLMSIESTVSKLEEDSHQIDETSNTEATEVQTTTQQYTSRKCKQKVNSLMSNDSDIPDPVKPKDESSIEVIQVMGRRRCKILKPTHETNSLKCMESTVSTLEEDSHQRDVHQASIKVASSALENGMSRQRYNTRKKTDPSDSKKPPTQEDTGEHIRKGVSLALASGTIRQKYNTRNKTDPSESKKMPHTKDVGEPGAKKKEVPLATGNETCKLVYKLQKKTNSMESKKMHLEEEYIISTFEEAVFHKNEGVAMARCVTASDFTAGYVEIDRQRRFTSKTTNVLFHVLDGNPEVTINKTRKCVKPGTFVYIPPDALYHIKNSHSKRARLMYTKIGSDNGGDLSGCVKENKPTHKKKK